MTQVVSPVAPQFISLTEAEVLAALDDPNTANPIAFALASEFHSRRCAAFTPARVRSVIRLRSSSASWGSRFCISRKGLGLTRAASPVPIIVLDLAEVSAIRTVNFITVELADLPPVIGKKPVLPAIAETLTAPCP